MNRWLLLTSSVILALGAGCGSDPKQSGNRIPDGWSADALADAAGDIGTPEPDMGGPGQDQWHADLAVPDDTAGQADVPTPEDVKQPDGSSEDIEQVQTCGFQYGFPDWNWPGPTLPSFASLPSSHQPGESQRTRLSRPDPLDGITKIAHGEPEPPYTYTVPMTETRADIVMPGYSDSMPAFSRTQDWEGGTRCYETPNGALLLSEDLAYDLYREIAERTTGHQFDSTPGRRSVLGLRGGYPGTFSWNGNGPNRFNDTLVLIWRESDGSKQVLEWPVHTDTGPYDFGEDSSSSLWPNRHYPYKCGWHKNYNALAIDIVGYYVWDDTNNNGHWDSDRNGWFEGMSGQAGDDHGRAGSAHNIHMGSVDGPLNSAEVANWSAGCQVIPGMANWERFITHAWTKLGDEVDYYLIDVRDIDRSVWLDCTEDGSHECPYRMPSLPFYDEGNTSLSQSSSWGLYNCSAANEGGPELVYTFTTQTELTLHVSVDDDPGDASPDVDVHLLMGDDPDACMARDNVEFEQWVPPGRYVVIVDSYVEGGTALSGPYELNVEKMQ